MKLLCLVFAMPLFLILAKAEIKNGYVDVENARVALRSLKLLTSSDTTLNEKQSRNVNDRIKVLTDYINYFEITNILLNEFTRIVPDLFADINGIKDKAGSPTDVYVKFIPMNQVDGNHPGATYIQYKQGDDTNYSEYGANTVSIKIWIMDTSLTILAHEFGHVKYEVPNLSDYQNYQKANPNINRSYRGHNPSDLSGQSASTYEKKFSRTYSDYLKSTMSRRLSPFKIARQVREANEVVTSAKEQFATAK